jgi:phenylacetate-CoA ligase
MSRIVGRTDDMLIIRGVNVFPSQVEAALVGLEHLAPHHQLVVTRTRNLDELEVRVEATNEFFHAVGADVFAGHPEISAESVKRQEECAEHRLREALGLNVKVILTEPNSLPRSDGGKLNRVVDRRGLYN